MTETPGDFEIPEEAVEAASLAVSIPRSTARIALRAALPHLRVQEARPPTLHEQWHLDHPGYPCEYDTCPKGQVLDLPAPAPRSVVDREAMAQAAHHRFCLDPSAPTHRPDQRDYDKADEILEVLALLPTEAETATELGRRVGRKEAGEEIAAAIEYNHGWQTPAQQEALDFAARIARNITKGDS